MTPGARVAAAIGLLDEILAGTAAEKALTAWARRSRFAGSKDREAVRDHVFDALRNLQGYQALAGEDGWPPSGRALMVGALRATGADPADVFTGQGHAPQPLDAAEARRSGSAQGVFNMPDWVRAELQSTLGHATAAQQARLMADRAPISLRANAARISRDALRDLLGPQGFLTRANPLAPEALTVIGSARGLMQTAAYRDGLFEMQDAGSQAVVAALDLPEGGRVLDFCAGGGGKSLAIAARASVRITAHDANPARMKDLQQRARRAGIVIGVERDRAALLERGYDLVLLDVPCSGSGAWRRSPEAKWAFTRERLDDLLETQRSILAKAQDYVADGGSLAYVTCSILTAENEAQRDWFENTFSGWSRQRHQRWLISNDGDGFFMVEYART